MSVEISILQDSALMIDVQSSMRVPQLDCNVYYVTLLLILVVQMDRSQVAIS